MPLKPLKGFGGRALGIETQDRTWTKLASEPDKELPLNVAEGIDQVVHKIDKL